MAPAPKREPEQAPPTVLVVEDEVLVRLAVCDYLRDCGYRVLEAGNADEAIGILGAGFHVDVVFTDIKMPGSLDGFDLARRVRRSRPGVGIILVSGVHRAADVARDLCEDGPLLPKPYSFSEVENRIRTLVAKRPVMD